MGVISDLEESLVCFLRFSFRLFLLRKLLSLMIRRRGPGEREKGSETERVDRLTTPLHFPLNTDSPPLRAVHNSHCNSAHSNPRPTRHKSHKSLQTPLTDRRNAFIRP